MLQKLEVAQEIGSNLPHEIKAALNVVYFPQLGYLIVLPKYRQPSGSGNQSNHNQSTAISDDPYLCFSGFELQVIGEVTNQLLNNQHVTVYDCR
jgi:DNA mismatch repair protein MSH5